VKTSLAENTARSGLAISHLKLSTKEMAKMDWRVFSSKTSEGKASVHCGLIRAKIFALHKFFNWFPVVICVRDQR
jgi:hypothetical protein